MTTHIDRTSLLGAPAPIVREGPPGELDEVRGERESGRPVALDGIDANFLYAESTNVWMHTMKVVVFAPGSEATLNRAYLREQVADVALRLPALRRRLVTVPLDIHHPRWLELDQIEVDHHLEFVELDGAAGEEELCELVAELAAEPLPRTRPLWQLHVVTGLAEGRFAGVVKLHHSVADGRAAANLLSELSVEQPGEWTPPQARGGSNATRAKRWQLFLWGLAGRARSLLELPMLLVRRLAREARARLDARPRGRRARLFGGPHTFFGARLGHHRRFAVRSFEVDEIRRIKGALGVSFNDVVVALVSGGVARLRGGDGADRIRGRAMVFSMPFATDDASDRVYGNFIANELCCLCDDIADPLARLRAITRATKLAKWRHEVLGPARLREWAELFTRRWVRLMWKLVPSFVAPPINLIISSVRGPAGPRWIGRARIESLWSVGPLVQRAGLNATAWSYAGTLEVALLGDATQWSEARFEQLCAGLDASYDELSRLADEADQTRAADVAALPP